MPSPVDIWFAGMNSPEQGHLSGLQIRLYLSMLWTTLPIFYILMEFLFWIASADKTNWNLDKYPKTAVSFVLNHKTLTLATFLFVYNTSYFIYGFLVGVFAFPLVVIALWKL